MSNLGNSRCASSMTLSITVRVITEATSLSGMWTDASAAERLRPEHHCHLPGARETPKQIV